MHRAVLLDFVEVGRSPIRSHVPNLHGQELRAGPPEEVAGCLVRGHVVPVVIPDEDSDRLQLFDGLAEERQLRDLLGALPGHSPASDRWFWFGSTSWKRAPCGTASS
ncbi:MAG: hypothetical protein QOF43_136 [Gaiellaceae bacterium]|nr:hypothetical protein [Gaiellaceae bacterium]